jgi:50S ribosomal protein L16 3-hydroxylase
MAPGSAADLVRTHLGRSPFARAKAAASAMALLDWQVLDRLLAGDPAPDVLVVSRGQLIRVRPPRSLAATRALLRRGVGLVLRRTDRCDPALAAAARSFEEQLGGRAHVQVFVTPAGTHGFGWHYDLEEVFVAQTVGIKDYYFRANTVVPPGQLPDMQFSRFRDETSPLGTARLLPGDWLYLPAGWWHMALCAEDSLSISVGVDDPRREAVRT